MKKTININLGGSLLTINEDAYELLNDYIDKLERHFKNSNGYEEIIGDIENRMAELLHEKLKNKPIVDTLDVKEAISIMGTPDEFELEEDERQPAFHFSPGKKLFRDDEDVKLGGVCSGLSQYFGVKDVIWIRLGFLGGLFLGLGIAFPLYIVLWSILTTPKSAHDRLAMKGDPININSIAEYIENEVENISETMRNLGKKKVKNRNKKSIREDRSGFVY